MVRMVRRYQNYVTRYWITHQSNELSSQGLNQGGGLCFKVGLLFAASAMAIHHPGKALEEVIAIRTLSTGFGKQG